MKQLILLDFLMGFSAQMRAQEITMFSGFFDYQYYQDNNRISKKKVNKLFESHPEPRTHWERSKTFNTLS